MDINIHLGNKWETRTDGRMSCLFSQGGVITHSLHLCHVSIHVCHANIHLCHVSIHCSSRQCKFLSCQCTFLSCQYTFLSFMSFPYRLVNEVLAPGTLGPGRRYVLFPGENPLPSTRQWTSTGTGETPLLLLNDG